MEKIINGYTIQQTIGQGENTYVWSATKDEK